MSRGTIVIVDDDRAMCELLRDTLRKRGFTVEARTTAAEGLALLGGADVFVTDLNMPTTSGLALCRRVLETRPDVPVIVITAFGSMEAAIGAIRAGAWDFVTKPLDSDAFALVLDRAVQHRRLRDEVRRLREAVAATARFEEMVGSSPAMKRLHDLVDRVARQDVTVLITGESGTGKELVARALHRRSPRAEGPFVAVHCGMSELVVETELFGHVAGAFPEARAARAGLFFQAEGGTLFLDEVGALAPATQAKLLRALQERVARPLGGEREVPFDTRVVAATNRDLEAMVEAGTFREDLFYRLDVVEVEVPPLRQREGDVLLLAQHFLDGAAARMGKAVTGIARPAAERLLAHGWPGNVRELQNCMERAVTLAHYDHITVDDLPERVRSASAPAPGVVGEDAAELLSMDEVERRHVLRVLQAVGGSKTRAAKVLGFDRATLYRKLERYGVR